MQVKTVQIHWHEKQPIFAADFDPTCPTRLATAGGDNNVWRVVDDDASGEAKVQFAATLARHVKPVNCVRFSPNGQYLASASDGGIVVLWRQTSAPVRVAAMFGAEEDDCCDPSNGMADDYVEHWGAAQMFRASDLEDIYDLAWSPDSRFILFGLTDHSVQIWDVTSGQKVKVIKEHGHFVQGAAWDPLNVFIATQSADRSVKTYKIATRMNGSIHVQTFGKFARAPLSHYGPSVMPEDADKHHNMFLDETLLSFFRRLAFSPDGALLFMPAGIVPVKSDDGKGRHAFYVATRNQLSAGLPGLVVDGFAKGVIAVRPHPRLFKLKDGNNGSVFVELPYRIVYAVASQDAVALFDTTQAHPLATFTNLHYGTLTDVCWSADGKHLLVTATDGFATMVAISPADLGEMLSEEEQCSLLAEIRQRVAPEALPKPKLVDPLELDMALSSEPVAPTSEVDNGAIAGSEDENAIPMMDVDANQPQQQVNILPVKRKVMPPATSLNISTTSEMDTTQ